MPTRFLKENNMKNKDQKENQGEKKKVSVLPYFAFFFIIIVLGVLFRYIQLP